MCDSASEPLPPLPADEYVLDTPRMRELVASVRDRIGSAASPAEACESLEPLFSQLLADEGWLPEEFQEPAAESGMGGGIGQWLLFRAADRSLSLFSLVVPPREGGLDLLRRRPLARGDFYALLPPQNDVHRVRTTSDVTSVSIHLLANDTGCVARHTFDEETGEARPFRSGYVNADCAD
jgi:3-mercaptopropionate dioxygenase